MVKTAAEAVGVVPVVKATVPARELPVIEVEAGPVPAPAIGKHRRGIGAALRHVLAAVPDVVAKGRGGGVRELDVHRPLERVDNARDRARGKPRDRSVEVAVTPTTQGTAGVAVDPSVPTASWRPAVPESTVKLVCAFAVEAAKPQAPARSR